MDKKHEMIRMAAREFAESEIKPVAGELDEKEEFSVSLTQKMGEIGLFGMVIPEEYGGQGLDYISFIIAMEEVARVDGSQAATLAAGNSLGINPIFQYGSEVQRRKYLPGQKGPDQDPAPDFDPAGHYPGFRSDHCP